MTARTNDKRYSKLIPRSLPVVLTALILWPAAGIQAAGGRPEWVTQSLAERPNERARQVPVMKDSYRRYFERRGSDSVNIWVFFTDKALSEQGGFKAVADRVQLTERAERRRARIDRVAPVFADLPVSERYIAGVESTGAVKRRASRWLNAASFRLPADRVAAVGRLEFVAEIKPLGRYRREPVEVSETRDRGPSPLQSAEYALNYGESIYQLEQLNVPAVHDLGYSGLGVTLAILDTGMRKTHDAFALHYDEGRVLAEYDFVHNDANVDYQPGDAAAENDHGTKVWSVAGGYDDGVHYGPAYRANFILCKTEDITSETTVEEDNWVAAMEFADSIGTDVITSSLGYLLFDDSCNCDYSYADMDGQTAITSIAASMADGLGIVVTKSAGNSGSAAGTITAPADAFDILAVGAVSGTGEITSFSSRGPTYDGRIKPEVCARGYGTHAADNPEDFVYGQFYGTSFSAPLIAGAVCLVLEAHPDWSPYQVREALKASGNYAANPNNTYGWGIVDVLAAIEMDPPCCRGTVGNVASTGDNPATIGDIAAMIDRLFISLTRDFDCLTEADVNMSGGGQPQIEDITIGDITALIDHLFVNMTPLPDCP